jgi:hypothetical protein
MKTIFHLPFILILFGMVISGSLISQANVVGAGGNGSSPEGIMSFTIGQISANILDSPGHSITEGVQQPHELFVVSIFTDPDLGLSVEVFPNPTSTHLILRTLSREYNYTTRFSISDVNGRVMTSQVFTSDETIIPMTKYTPGTYILTLFQGEMPVHQFKIMKL